MWDEKNCGFAKPNGDILPFNTLAEVEDVLPFDKENVLKTIELFERDLPKDHGCSMMSSSKYCER